ncbi:hypothetical protein WICPIJ_000455 [Wickerhamomyces pijperi]|uniref:Uncharacterized protein n=1 Tax=Wickerhamomyces pijperi TaxID=599730 RepID=A0A9P8QGQ5_WICPI|nr:hypothetical protein WICPIJ_000455 [Wickerhamomyces pijperi]
MSIVGVTAKTSSTESQPLPLSNITFPQYTSGTKDTNYKITYIRQNRSNFITTKELTKFRVDEELFKELTFSNNQPTKEISLYFTDNIKAWDQVINKLDAERRCSVLEKTSTLNEDQVYTKIIPHNTFKEHSNVMAYRCHIKKSCLGVLKRDISQIDPHLGRDGSFDLLLFDSWNGTKKDMRLITLEMFVFRRNVFVRFDSQDPELKESFCEAFHELILNTGKNQFGSIAGLTYSVLNTFVGSLITVLGNQISVLKRSANSEKIKYHALRYHIQKFEVLLQYITADGKTGFRHVVEKFCSERNIYRNEYQELSEVINDLDYTADLILIKEILETKIPQSSTSFFDKLEVKVSMLLTYKLLILVLANHYSKSQNHFPLLWLSLLNTVRVFILFSIIWPLSGKIRTHVFNLSNWAIKLLFLITLICAIARNPTVLRFVLTDVCLFSKDMADGVLLWVEANVID